MIARQAKPTANALAARQEVFNEQLGRRKIINLDGIFRPFHFLQHRCLFDLAAAITSAPHPNSSLATNSSAPNSPSTID
jgi:hypothetical protein